MDGRPGCPPSCSCLPGHDHGSPSGTASWCHAAGGRGGQSSEEARADTTQHVPSTQWGLSLCPGRVRGLSLCPERVWGLSLCPRRVWGLSSCPGKVRGLSLRLGRARQSGSVQEAQGPMPNQGSPGLQPCTARGSQPYLVVEVGAGERVRSRRRDGRGRHVVDRLQCWGPIRSRLSAGDGCHPKRGCRDSEPGLGTEDGTLAAGPGGHPRPSSL